ncbi:MAG: 3-hydroxyacyl-CoA dehydrogenase/enoyl-CoA hydratase family protein [Legionella sp.]
MHQPIFIKKIAVLGAGVMGAQIAAHCVNAGIPTLLYDLSSTADNPNAIVDKAIQQLHKLNPSPLATAQTASFLQACNYDDHLPMLHHCDLVIEAIAERIDWKEALYHRIVPYLAPNATIVSNTSGLSINMLSRALPEHLRHRFCGVHFFNPPRYMHLAELIAAQETDLQLLDHLESWLTSHLGKGVVRAKDTPNFIANRIGVFSLLSVMHHAQTFELGFDEVDALTGLLLNRPKSATFRTMDIVGLDTMEHVIHTMDTQLISDPWHQLFKLPQWLIDLIKQGYLGQKTRQGIYRKKGDTIEVFDRRLNDYRLAIGKASKEVHDILKIHNLSDRISHLFASSHPQAKFLVACFIDLFHYCTYHASDIADTVRDIDFAIRWGFGWQYGPFELWQDAGFDLIKNHLLSALTKQATISQAKLPNWLTHISYFYNSEGAYAPMTNDYRPRSCLPVYQRQLFPERVGIETSTQPKKLYENDGIVLWRIDHGIGVISFKTKANIISQSVIDGIHASLDFAEQNCTGLIFYQQDGNNFSAGADLAAVAAFIEAKNFNALEIMVNQFQQVMMRLKYSVLPIIAALRGRALGGGCELIMHTDRIVAAFEANPGLVELGVGLIPAGGGCKELARRASQQAVNGELMPHLQPYFEQITKSVVAGSAPDALQRGYLQKGDLWIMNTHEVLYTAIAEMNAMLSRHYKPPIPTPFKVAGRQGHAGLRAGLVNWLESDLISEHDYFIADQLASVLCGGDVNSGTLVDEQWLLDLEREAFIRLAASSASQERINSTLAIFPRTVRPEERA